MSSRSHYMSKSTSGLFILLIAIFMLPSCNGGSIFGTNLHRIVAIAGLGDGPYYAGKAVHFFNNGSYDPDGNAIVKYKWDWNGDGTWDEEGADVSHTWGTPGKYKVIFGVTDNQGETGIDELQVDIVAQGYNFDKAVDVTPPGLNFGPEAICYDGNYAYIAAGIDGLNIFDVSYPSNPIWVKKVDTPAFATDVAVGNGYAFVAVKPVGLLIIDVTHPGFAHVVKTIDISSGNESLAYSNGYVYLVDDQKGLFIIDVRNPEKALIVKTIDTLKYANDISVSNGYAYIADLMYGLKIFRDQLPGIGSSCKYGKRSGTVNESCNIEWLCLH